MGVGGSLHKSDEYGIFLSRIDKIKEILGVFAPWREIMK
jgi:hypothetical protein